MSEREGELKDVREKMTYVTMSRLALSGDINSN